MSTFSVGTPTATSFSWSVSGLTPINNQSKVYITATDHGSSCTTINDAIDQVTTGINETSGSGSYTSGDASLSFNQGDSFYVYAYRYTDKWYLIGSAQWVVIPLKLATPSYYGTSNVTSSAITVDYNYVPNANYYDINCYTSGGSLVDSRHTTNGTATFTGLSPGSGYKFKCQATSDYSDTYPDSSWSAFSAVTTTDYGNLSTPTVSSHTDGYTTVDITLNAVSNATNYAMDIYEYVAGAWSWKRYKAAPNRTFNWTGLDSSRQYKFVFYATALGYNNSPSSTVYYTTLTPAPGVPASEVVCTGVQDGGLSLSWGTSQYATSYDLCYWYLVNGTVTGLTTINVSGTSKTLTGLNYGTTYYFNVRGSNSAGKSDWASVTAPAATIRPKPPTISASNITKNSVRITTSGMSGKWNTITVYQYESNGTTLKSTGTITNGSDAFVDFTNLTASATYIFKAKSTVTSDGGTTLDSLSYSANLSVTAAANLRPATFDWTYAGWNVATGAAVAGTSKSSSYNLYVTADEWNALIDNLQLVYTYKGGGSTGISHVTAGNNMAAAQFNAVKNAINAYNATGIADKTAGSSDILYSDFNTLRTKLNAIT